MTDLQLKIDGATFSITNDSYAMGFVDSQFSMLREILDDNPNSANIRIGATKMCQNSCIDFLYSIFLLDVNDMEHIQSAVCDLLVGFMYKYEIPEI